MEKKNSKTAPSLLVLLLSLLFMASCASPEPQPLDYSRPLAPGEKALIKVEPADYPDFKRAFNHREDLLDAVEQSIAYMYKPSSASHFPVEGISHERVLRSLESFRDVITISRSAGTFNARIKEKFDVYMSTGCDGLGTVLFTGYCEPIIPASLTRTDKYRYPLYHLPDDLVKNEKGKTLGRRTPSGRLVPYYTRMNIDKRGALEGRGLELAWVENALDAYIVHVQGSATLQLPDGSKRKIGYAGKNGRPYASLGKALVEDGKIEASEISLENIRKHFDRSPNEMAEYLYKNESYIFFTESEGGPFGSIGARVTPLRTIATDKSIFPRASVTFISTELPDRNREGKIGLKPYNGFALDQDTGGAIRSAGRVDVFLGTGDEAEMLAGWTRCEGKLYYLFIREG